MTTVDITKVIAEEPLDADKVLAEEKESIAGGYGCDHKRLIAALEQSQKRVAELRGAEAYWKDERDMWKMDSEKLKAELEQGRKESIEHLLELLAKDTDIHLLKKRVAELEGHAKLAEWARHDPGCNYIDNAAYGCRCGLLEAQEALTRIDG